jgi:2'-aminobiphenyl-2,3-diol 1,2-dioxygenase, small subunit
VSEDLTGRLHPVHRLIQALGRDAAVQARFGADPAAVFAEFGLSDAQVAALKDGSVPALAAIGVHPILRMHWFMMSQPEEAASMSVGEYMSKFTTAAANG